MLNEIEADLRKAAAGTEDEAESLAHMAMALADGGIRHCTVTF